MLKIGTCPARVLVLAPHTDDGEFGCGGTIARYIEDGSEVYYIAFSSAEKSLSPGMPKDILRREVKAATEVLGIPSNHLIVLNYDVRTFPTFRQEILEDLVRFNSELKPDLVLLPSTVDTHQDHQTISEEGFRAFKKTTMLGYEIPWNNLTFTTNAFVALEERHVTKKLTALRCYESQAHRSYASEEFVRSLLRTRGVPIDAQYAEAFEVIRWIQR